MRTRAKGERGRFNVTTPTKYAFHHYQEYCRYYGRRPVNYATYTKILDAAMNKLVATAVRDGNVPLPCSIGYIEIIPFEITPHFVNIDGKRVLKGLSSVNWGATYKLWDEHPETRGVKKVRYTDTRKYQISMRFNNRFSFMRKFKFVPTTSFRRLLSEAIRNNSIFY